MYGSIAAITIWLTVWAIRKWLHKPEVKDFIDPLIKVLTLNPRPDLPYEHKFYTLAFPTIAQERLEKIRALVRAMPSLRTEKREDSGREAFFKELDEFIEKINPARRPDVFLELFEKLEGAVVEQFKKRIVLAINKEILGYDFEDAQDYLERTLEPLKAFSEKEYQIIIKPHLEKRQVWRLEALLEKNKFNEADAFFSKEQFISRSYFQSLKEKRVSDVFAEVRAALEKLDFEGGEALRLEMKSLVPELWGQYDSRLEEYLKKKEVEKKIADFLGRKLFFEADALVDSTDYPKQEYERRKAGYVQKHFKEKWETDLSDEQAYAVSKISKHLLIKAGAGAGKTSVLVSKVLYLLDAGVNLDEILLLAFNRAAAKEIRQRVRVRYGISKFDRALTFHSLAKRIANVSADKIIDINKKDKGQHGFVEAIFEQNRSSLIDSIYSYFREELTESQQKGYEQSLGTLEEQVLFRRNLRFETLNGEMVKSNGEKFIADFLFEHGFDKEHGFVGYEYERSISISQLRNEVWFADDASAGPKFYRPDFYFEYKEKKYLIEHWGIDEKTPEELPEWWDDEAPEDSRTKWEKYRDRILAKREFYQASGYELIETSVLDLKCGRGRFEETLKERLLAKGVPASKLSSEEIISKFQSRQKNIPKLVNMLVQFIHYAKINMLSPSQVFEIVKENADDTKVGIFHRLGAKIYEEYEKQLKSKELTDFNSIIKDGIFAVARSPGLQRLKYILIDEYQDFSKLFHTLITEIQRFNPEVRIIAVGDDRQAINSFAGSDLSYFSQFDTNMENSDVCDLAANYRSREEVVMLGNAFWLDRATPQKCQVDGKGLIRKCDLSSPRIRVESVKGRGKYAEDQKFKFAYDPDFIRSKALKICHFVISNSKYRDKEVVILSRTKMFRGVSLVEFENKLEESFGKSVPTCLSRKRRKEDEGKIVKTIHSYKGCQADIVIVLDVTSGNIPKVHPDNCLYEIFGRSVADALAEEERLFYVAITRAKEAVFFLTETEAGSESPYLSRLGHLITDIDYRKLFSASGKIKERGSPYTATGCPESTENRRPNFDHVKKPFSSKPRLGNYLKN